MAQIDFGSNDRKRFAAHEACAEAREVALIRAAKFAEDEHRNDAVQNGIAEEFQPFVVSAPHTAMRQGSFE
jgi:hypothetical protein